MASGTINGAKQANNYAQIVWSSSKVSGGSNVTATLYWIPTGAWYFTYRNTYTLTINGNSKTGSGAKHSGSGKKTLLTHTVKVSYTGNKSINISGSIPLSNVYYESGGYYLGTYKASGTAALDRVGEKPSTPTVTAPKSQVVSETGANVTISWTKASSYSGSGGYKVEVSINDGAWNAYQTISNINTLSTTYRVPSGQGGLYRFRVSAYNDIGSSSYSYSEYINRNVLSAPDIEDIGFYNPFTEDGLWVGLTGGGQNNGQPFRRLCALYYGSTWLWGASYSSVGDKNDHVTVTYAANSYLTHLGAKAYSSSNFRIVAWIQNANGSRSNYAEKYFTVDINADNGAKPTFGIPTLSGGLLGHPSTVFVAGVNSVTVNVPTATTNRAPSGVTLSYSVEMDGVGTKSGQTVTFSNLTAGVKEIIAKVTDSRGLSSYQTIYCMVQPWAKPSITITSCDRIDNGTTAKLSYSMSYSPIYEYPTYNTLGNQINNINTQQYKITAEWKTSTSGMTLTGLNTELSYNISVRCSDIVSPTSYSQSSITVPTIMSLLSLRGHGVGIGCIPSTGYALDVTGNVKITGTSLTFTQFGATKKIIEISGGDSTGLGVKIGGGGGLTLYSGEAGNFVDTGASEYLNVASDGQINFYTNYDGGSSGGHRTYISAAGNLYCDKNISCVSLSQTSDLRLKTDITTIENSDEFILSLKPIEFKFVDDEGYHMGFGAQHVKNSCEDIFDKDMAIYTTNEEGKLALNYSEFIPPMVAMLQQLYNDVNTIKHNIVKEG